VILQMLLPVNWPPVTWERPVEPVRWNRSEMLRRACVPLRSGDLQKVEGLLNAGGRHAAGDAACLNLLGVVAEARGRIRAARRFYGRSMRAEATFGPAEQNLRRLYELKALGRTTCPVAVGDPETDLWLARLTGPSRRHS